MTLLIRAWVFVTSLAILGATWGGAYWLFTQPGETKGPTGPQISYEALGGGVGCVELIHSSGREWCFPRQHVPMLIEQGWIERIR